MSRFLVVVKDRTAKFNTLSQVETFLSRAVPDASKAEIYELRMEAQRNQWSFDPVKVSADTATKSVKAKSKKLSNSGKSWTDADDRILKTGLLTGAPVREIAAILERSTGAVYCRKSALEKASD